MEFDILIRGGRVVNGDGATPAHPADVGIIGDRIAAVGDLAGAMAAETVDAAGMVVAPGFIDVHPHSETNLRYGPHRYGGLSQGVTTQFTAPDGFGWAGLPPNRARELWAYTEFAYGAQPRLPLDDLGTVAAYVALFAGNTPANVALQVPHCAVRLGAMGWDARPATDDELDAMRATTRAWLDAGARCLDLGLDYQPSASADLRELVELLKVAREYGAIYAAHLRYNLLGRVGAWREIIEIGKQADIPVHVSHETVTEVTGPLLDEAQGTCDLTFESYLYPAGASHLTMMLPVPDQAGGVAGVRTRLANPTDRLRLQDALTTAIDEATREGAYHQFIATPSGRYVGMRLLDAAAACGETPGAFAVRLLMEEEPYAMVLFHRDAATRAAFPAITRDTIRHPAMMVASDGVYHGPLGHPRGYGCFAQVLRLCVRETGAVSLETAVHKMSGFPAVRFGLRDRGLLREGYGADVVIFDPDTVADRSTWDDPWVGSVGIERVLVNGVAVVRGGEPTGALPGRVLR